MIDKAEYNLHDLNTFGINARCSRFVEIESVGEAAAILPSLAAERTLVVGRGSNLLLTKDFSGTVIRSGIRGISVADDGLSVLLRCGSGERWDDVVEYAVSHDLYGAENLSYIPGDTGAAAVQNIGAYGAEIKDILHSVEAVETATGQCSVIMKDECGYGYRQSRFKRQWRGRFFITHVTLRLSREFLPRLSYSGLRQALVEQGINQPSARQLRNTLIDIRRRKLPDPDVLGNAGSFFTNPIVARTTAERLQTEFPDMPSYDVDADNVKLSAGWLIEQSGWKGRALGRAAVYDKQALVLVNRGGATGEDILRLCRAIQQDVSDKFSIRLVPEVNIV